MRVHKFTVNPFQENTYLLINSNRQAIIIDPGFFEPDEEQMLTQFVETEELNIVGIWCTHCHLDHLYGAKFCSEKYKLPVLIPEKDLETFRMAPKSAAMYGLPTLELPEHYQLTFTKKEYQIGDETIEVRFTPGHSVGHVVFIHHGSKTVIGGDVLFQGSIGRTDLPGGDFSTLEQSIQDELYSLDDGYTVYPGHGLETTIGWEKENNPFVKPRV